MRFVILYKKLFKLLGLGIFAVSVLSFSILLIYSIMPKIMDVQYIRIHPELFNHNIRVIGKVHIEYDNPSFFLLLDNKKGNHCKAIPVVYKGQRPDADSEIIVYGQVRKVDKTFNEDILWREYFLDADKINTRKNSVISNLSYSVRNLVHEFGLWLRKRNQKIFILIRKLIPLQW